MSDKHFALDIDPEPLRTAATQVGELAAELQRYAGRAEQTPAEIGDRWLGNAATDVKAEMTSLGAVLDDFATRLDPVPEALRGLARDFDDALEQLPGLNQRWDQAEQDYQDAVGRADQNLREQREELTASGDRPVPFIQHELRSARDSAVSSAATARNTTQNGLETEFTLLTAWLRRRIGETGTEMRSSGPVRVPDLAVTQWQSGQGPDVDLSSLLARLGLAEALEQQREAERIERLHEAAREEARAALEDLQQAIEDRDVDAINEALEEIGSHADDEIWSEEMVRELGPEGLQGVFADLDDLVAYEPYVIEEIWPGLEAFTNTAANGVSQLDGDDFASYFEEWMEADYGPKMWALLASADAADGRINAAALVNQSEVYNASLRGDGTGMFPIVFNWAYDDADMLEQWASRSNGEDLADIVEHLPADFLREQMFRMHNVQVPGGTMNEDQYRLVADLYGETLVELQRRFLERIESGDLGAEPTALLVMLESRNLNVGQGGGIYTDMLRDSMNQVASDPAFVSWWMAHTGDEVAGNDISRSAYRDLLRDGDVDVDQLIADVIAHELARGDAAPSVATTLGDLLRAQDLLGNEVDLAAVTKALVDSGLSLLDLPPGVSQLKSVLEAMFAEYQRMEAIDADSDSDERAAKAQKTMVLALYVQATGEAPPGFEDFVAEHGLEDDPDAAIEFYEHLRREDSETYQYLQRLYDQINGGRDDAL